ncbi:MAG: hypothetical protein JOZ86_14575 [Candidatus Eremiobacteraeota bacterium]|nr:hypothetical protein [Candidatus Eremiobacteraeota bacterium]
MTTPRYRRSSVRAVLESTTQDHVVAAEAHDALWAVLWNRRYDDVDEPVWFPEASYWGILAFARVLDQQTTLAGVDTGESFIVVRSSGTAPPIGSRVRVVPASREYWRFVDVQPLGLGIELRFEDQSSSADADWLTALRDGVVRVRELLETRRESLAARRSRLGALNEPATLEEIWREEIGAISDRIALETEYTPNEHASLAKARARGQRSAEEEERKIVAARKRRFTERANEAVAAFREERWPEIRDKAIVQTRRYVDYRTEVVRLEDAMQRIRSLTDRAAKATIMLDAVERAGFRVRKFAFDPERLDEAAYAEELLRTVELLFSSIPLRAVATATSFSAYRAPTAGPSVVPPRL